MKQIIILFSLFNFYFSFSNTSPSKLVIEFNENISTYSIVERIVADHKGWLFYIDGKRDYSYLPMVKKAFDKFGKKDNTQIIRSTLKYLSIVGNQQDVTYQALLRHKKFPEKGFLYPLKDLGISEEKLKATAAYVEDLRVFFIENKLSDFFAKNDNFISGGLKEFKKSTPLDYFEKMEEYYGEKFVGCRIYPDPFNTVPIEEGDTDFFHGSGPKIKTKNGNLATMISSAFIPLGKKDKTVYGFDHPKFIKMIVTHEFGHSFINDLIYKEDLGFLETDKIFDEDFLNIMKPYGYGHWKVCLVEHLVRLGEIRIAEAIGDKARANELRKIHVEEYHFKYIPYLEEQILEYENNRDKYKEFKDFLPILLESLNAID